MTAATSSAGSCWSRPSVAHTTAWLGPRPVAKALGWAWGEMATVGIGMPARVARSATMAWSWG